MTQAQGSTGEKKTEMNFSVWGCHLRTASGKVFPAPREFILMVH